MNNYFLQKTREGKVFHSHNTTTGAVTVLSSTFTGLCLDNPYGSGKDLIIESMSFVGSTLGAIGEIGVCIAPNVSTIAQTGTAAVVHNGKLGGGDLHKGVGRTFSISPLLSTPVWLETIGSARVTANAVEGLESLYKRFDGTLVIAPGFYVGLQTLTTARTGLCSITWAEDDIL